MTQCVMKEEIEKIKDHLTQLQEEVDAIYENWEEDAEEPVEDKECFTDDDDDEPLGEWRPHLDPVPQWYKASDFLFKGLSKDSIGRGILLWALPKGESPKDSVIARFNNANIFCTIIDEVPTKRYPEIPWITLLGATVKETKQIGEFVSKAFAKYGVDNCSFWIYFL